jgi:hypothetical protein
MVCEPNCIICNDETDSFSQLDRIEHKEDIVIQFMVEFKMTIAGLATNPMVQAFLPPHVREQLKVGK